MIALEMEEPEDGADRIQELLDRVRNGDRTASSELFRLLYPELKARAHSLMSGQANGHTLQATAILNEAFLRFCGHACDWKTREHFLLGVSLAMRHVLTDHARGKHRQKREGQRADLPLDELAIEFEESAYDLEKLSLALDEFREVEPDIARAVELRFFGGATMEEAARILNIPKRSLERSWKVARAWLFARMQ